jgi:hypothetical protein
VVLRVQGDDAVHDAIRIRELEAAVPRRVVAALHQHGTSNDDVLWAALFVLAVLVRDNSCVFERAKGALAWAGVMRVSIVLLLVRRVCAVARLLHVFCFFATSWVLQQIATTCW